MNYNNIHDLIGWGTCANLRCLADLEVDHVSLITTAHLRRFCSVACITEGHAVWLDALGHSVRDEVDHWEWIRLNYRLPRPRQTAWPPKL
jgi:hypothetical protein